MTHLQSNEKRVFSDPEVIAELERLGVELVVADATDDTTERTQQIKRDLARTDRVALPVNLIYPADPKKPAILLEGPMFPKDALEALRRVSQ